MTLNLTINNVDNTVGEEMYNLSANADGAIYQWIDCTNNNLPLPGETNQTFNAVSDGAFAVIVTQNDCSDTSSCYNIVITGIMESTFESEICLYPNPTSGSIFLLLDNVYRDVNIKIFNLEGQLVLKKEYHNSDTFSLDISELINGFYFLTVSTIDKAARLKFVKK